MALAVPSSSTTPAPKIPEDDDAVQVVIPDKHRVFSDMKAMVDYYETQTDMAQKKIIQAENQLVVEKNRVSELQKEKEALQKKLAEAEESCVTTQKQVQQERTELEIQRMSLKCQVQYLQNQLRDGKEQVHSLLNITRVHICDAHKFSNNFGDISKNLMKFFPVNETPTPPTSAPSTSSLSSAGEHPRTISKNPSENLGGREKEAPLPGSNLSSSPAKSRPKKKHAKTKSIGWRMERIKNHLQGLSLEPISAGSKAELEAYMKSILAPAQKPQLSSSSPAVASTTKRTITATVTENREQAAKKTKN